jgi:small subunit ribosomal protein S4e
MATSHLKRLNAPKTWKIKRRGIIFVSRPNPGPHRMELCLPLNILIRDVLSHAKTAKEVKQLVNAKDIMVNGKVVKEIKYPVGLFDILQIPKLDETYRMMLDNLGHLALIKIDKKESKLFPAKILSKKMLRGGKMQLNLSAGINLLVEKNHFKTGETLMLEMPGKSIAEHIKLEKGAYIFLAGGSHIGDHGVVEDIKDSKIFYKSASGTLLETPVRFVTIVGHQKSSITLN